MHNVRVVDVFKSSQGGGNPAPIVIDADGLEAEKMMSIAQAYGHESGFVLPAATDNDYRFRFFVPLHEMSMCGHATIGTVWLLHTLGKLGSHQLSIETLSGNVKAQIHQEEGEAPFIEISQPLGTVSPIKQPELRDQIIQAIGLEPEDILDLPFLNAVTSRVKTLIPVKSPQRLDAAHPESARIEALCEELGSTGFYLFCQHPDVALQFDSRQFPKASGYPEDAATGIAATALLFGLLEYAMISPDAASILVHQGRAMGRPSDIYVRFDLGDTGLPKGCFVGGYSAFAADQLPSGVTHGQ